MRLTLKILVLPLLANVAFGQNIITPEAAVQAVLQNHPLTKAAAFEVKAKQYGEKAAINIPNPEINTESPTGEFYTVGVQQSFEFPTVYTRQRQVAKAETALAKAGQRMNENELRYTTRLRYLETQVAEYKAEQWRARDTMYQQIAATAIRQFAAGEIDFLQKTMMENEAGIVHQERLAAEQTSTKLRLHLKKITGFEDLGNLAPLRFDTLEELFLPDGERLVNPSVAYQQQAAQVAEKQSGLAKIRALPNFSLGYINQGARSTPLDYRFRASIGVPLWAGQYRAAQKIARSENQAAIARVEAEAQTIALETQSAVTEALTAWSKLLYHEREALPRSRSLTAAANRMREAGQIDYITFLRVLDEAFAIQLEYAEQLAALGAARFRVQYLSGK